MAIHRERIKTAYVWVLCALQVAQRSPSAADDGLAQSLYIKPTLEPRRPSKIAPIQPVSCAGLFSHSR